MTVQQLIDKLTALSADDKRKKVVINADGEPFDVSDIDMADGLVWIESD